LEGKGREGGGTDTTTTTTTTTYPVSPKQVGGGTDTRQKNMLDSIVALYF